jgi:cyclomaltodextrinase
MKSASVLLVFLLAAVVFAADAEVLLLKKDATVWSRDQTIRGLVHGALPPVGNLSVNGAMAMFQVQTDSTFAVSVRLHEGENTLLAFVDSAGTTIVSDTLRLLLGLKIRPILSTYATVAGRDVTLHVQILENPDSAALAFSWVQDTRNPKSISLLGGTDSVASFSFPPDAPPGEYYFTVTGMGGGDTAKARTCVFIDKTSIRPFDITKDHAHWIDSAIVYTITPHIFVPQGTFKDITDKIPDFVELGVTTLWLMPIYPTTELNHGYHVTDYFSIRSDFGTEEDLHTLVSTAHAHGLRVILDFVPNHTTIYHPYAQDAIRYGPLSHYYDFYDRAGTGTGTRTIGLMTFTVYYYSELVNINLANPEAGRMMIEAGKYWIEKFDIDGYRLDMVWAVDERFPDYMKEWSRAVKQVKPEVFILAEAGSRIGRLTDERYDAAYDWSTDRWSWSGLQGLSDSAQTVSMLRSRIENVAVPGGRILRFLQNNDLPSFAAECGYAQLPLWTALLFSIHGIPMLYNGQEVGSLTHPYAGIPFFDRSSPIHAQDRAGVYPLYRQLTWLRKRLTPLMSDNYEEIPATAGVFAYHRWEENRHVFCVLHMGRSQTTAVLRVPRVHFVPDTTRSFYLTDMISGECLAVPGTSFDSLPVPMRGYSARILVLDTVALATTAPGEPMWQPPSEVTLSQNYPNPFNPTTTFIVDLPASADVSLSVYDVLGRLVTTLMEGVCAAGRRVVAFDAHRLAGGVYFAVFRAAGKMQVRAMLLLK